MIEDSSLHLRSPVTGVVLWNDRLVDGDEACAHGGHGCAHPGVGAVERAVTS